MKVREGIERVQYFKSKENVATMLKQSVKEIKSTWHINEEASKGFNIDCQQHFEKEYA